MNLRSFCLSISCSLLGCITQEVHDRTLVLTDKLSVNTINLDRYITRLDEQEGLKNIRELLTTPSFEEAWMYLPFKKEWHEVGKKEKIYEDGKRASIDHDINYELRLMQRNPEVVRYHFHKKIPEQNHLTDLLERALQRRDVPLTKRLLHEEIELLFGNVFASPTDMATMIEYSRIAPENTALQHKVCSEQGVVQYELTPRGKVNYYPLKQDARITMLEQRRKEALETFFADAYPDIVQRSAIDVLQEFATVYSNGDLEVTFASYK